MVSSGDRTRDPPVQRFLCYWLDQTLIGFRWMFIPVRSTRTAWLVWFGFDPQTKIPSLNLGRIRRHRYVLVCVYHKELSSHLRGIQRVSNPSTGDQQILILAHPLISGTNLESTWVWSYRTNQTRAKECHQEMCSFWEHSKPCLSIVEQIVRICAIFIYMCNTYATCMSQSNIYLSEQPNILVSNSKLWRARKSNVEIGVQNTKWISSASNSRKWYIKQTLRHLTTHAHFYLNKIKVIWKMCCTHSIVAQSLSSSVTCSYRYFALGCSPSVVCSRIIVTWHCTRGNQGGLSRERELFLTVYDSSFVFWCCRVFLHTPWTPTTCTTPLPLASLRCNYLKLTQRNITTHAHCYLNETKVIGKICSTRWKMLLMRRPLLQTGCRWQTLSCSPIFSLSLAFPPSLPLSHSLFITLPLLHLLTRSCYKCICLSGLLPPTLVLTHAFAREHFNSLPLTNALHWLVFHSLFVVKHVGSLTCM